MRTIDPKQTPIPDLHQYLLGSVAPRPIAFASTVDEAGRPNLAPYSFFNCFSSNPPTLVFSSNRRVRDNTTKDTLHNVETTGEVVINVVNYAIARQMALCSVEYPQGVSEFDKAGLTAIPSDLVRPFRVKESPVQMECRVREIVPLGTEGGAGHLIICEVLRMHIDENVLDERNRINPHKIDLMGRMGRAYYVRASGEAIHTILQPVDRLGMGFEGLPHRLRRSTILTGNNLAQLAALPEPPAAESVEALREDPHVRELLAGNKPVEALHRYAQRELTKENVELAARIAWLAERIGKAEE